MRGGCAALPMANLMGQLSRVSQQMDLDGTIHQLIHCIIEFCIVVIQF